MTPPTALTRSALARHPLPPIESGDKDKHGQILIIAGSRDVPGAALLAAHGAMRSGAGKLQIAAPDAIAVALGVAMPEAMVVGHATHRDGGFAQSAIARLVELARRADAIIAGPGLESNSTAAPLGRELLKLGRPLAIDAALLRILPECEAEARGATILPILLPHAGEMASLLGCKPEEVAADPLAAGRDCARRYRALVLVKGVQSHVVAPDGAAWKYSGGGPGLGVSGSGDTLAGIVGGLLARGADPLAALLWGYGSTAKPGAPCRSASAHWASSRATSPVSFQRFSQKSDEKSLFVEIGLELVPREPHDVDHVGRSRGLERHPGHDHHPLVRLGEVMAQCHPLGLADHFLEIVDIAGVDRMRAPLQPHPPRDLHARGHHQRLDRRSLCLLYTSPSPRDS